MVQIVIWLIDFLVGILKKLVPPHIHTAQQALCFIPCGWLGAAAKLGIADLLKDGPLTAAELAGKLGARETDIYRGMRMLVNYGFFEALPAERSQDTLFRNNPASAALREDHPNSVRFAVMHWHADAYDCYGPKAMEWLLEQQSPSSKPTSVFQHIHGQSFWEHHKANPEADKLFSKAMTNVDSLGIQSLMEDYHWGRFQRLVDVGGALGTVLEAALPLHPGCKGVLFDQPQVVDDARKYWKEKPTLAAMQDRIAFTGGDFFVAATYPKAQNGDLFFARNIIHDWSDEECVDILRALRKAIGSTDATVALLEIATIPEWGGFNALLPSTTDLLMRHVLTGKERSKQQFQDLFEASGFKLVKCHPTRSPMWVIEAQPV